MESAPPPPLSLTTLPRDKADAKWAEPAECCLGGQGCERAELRDGKGGGGEAAAPRGQSVFLNRLLLAGKARRLEKTTGKSHCPVATMVWNDPAAARAPFRPHSPLYLSPCHATTSPFRHKDTASLGTLGLRCSARKFGLSQRLRK